jgi:hypothetical protein
LEMRILAKQARSESTFYNFFALWWKIGREKNFG